MPLRSALRAVQNLPRYLSIYHGLRAVRDLTATATADLIPKLHDSPSHAHDIIVLDLTTLYAVRDAAASVSGQIASGEIPPTRVLIAFMYLMESHSCVHKCCLWAALLK